MYKVQYGLPENSLYIFDYSSSSYKLRSQCDLDIPFVSTENYGKNSLKQIGPIIQNSTPATLRNIETLTEFEKEICKWKIDKCTCM